VLVTPKLDEIVLLKTGLTHPDNEVVESNYICTSGIVSKNQPTDTTYQLGLLKHFQTASLLELNPDFITAASSDKIR